MKKIGSLLACITLSTALFSQNWTPMPAGVFPNGLVVWSISAVGEKVVWAVASTDANTIPSTHKIKILRSSDGGQTWTLLEVEEAPGRLCFQIVAEDSLTAWITTQDYGSGAGRALLKTTDGGINWTEKLKHRAAGVNLNRFADGQHWLATNRQYNASSSDDGETWALDTLTSYFANEYQTLYSGTNMAAVVGDTAWHGTNAGRIVRFTDYGQSVDFLPGLGAGFEILSVAFHDHLNGLAWSFYAATGQARIIKTTDGGATWAQLAQQPGNTNWNVAAVPGSPGFYVLSTAAYITNGRVAITKDFGETWSVEVIGKALNAVQFTSPESGWIGAGKISSATQPAIYKYIGSPLVGVKTPEPLLPGFSVSPTPATDMVKLDFEGIFSGATVFGSLTDLAGRTVFSGEIFDNQLSVSDLPAGVYFLKIETGGKIGVAKVLRQ